MAQEERREGGKGEEVEKGGEGGEVGQVQGGTTRHSPEAPFAG